jgi:hypothetical protein
LSVAAGALALASPDYADAGGASRAITAAAKNSTDKICFRFTICPSYI